MNDDSVRAIYDAMWLQGRPALAANRAMPYPMASDGRPIWGVSAVLRPDDEARAAIAALIAPLRSLFGEEHHYFAPYGFHTTLETIELFREGVDDGDAGVALYAGVLGSIASTLPPLLVRYRGLTATPSSVVVQGFADGLRHMRQAFRGGLIDKGVVLPGAIRDTAHLTLATARSTQIAGPAGLCEFIEARRDTPIALSHMRAVDLVIYEATSAGVDVRILASIPLGEGPSA